MIQKLWKNGFASIEDTTEALQLYQTYLNEIKSDQRDKAAKRCRCNAIDTTSAIGWKL